MATSEARVAANEPHLLRALTDVDLVALVSLGDLDAFGALYDRHAQPTWRVALHYSDDLAAAEQAVAAVFLDLWREPETTIQASLSAWLSSGVAREARNLRRGARGPQPLQRARQAQPQRIRGRPRRVAVHRRRGTRRPQFLAGLLGAREPTPTPRRSRRLRSDAVGLGRGQRERDAGAAAGAVLGPDPAAVRLDEAARDREPEARAARRASGVAAPEALEHAAQRLGESPSPSPRRHAHRVVAVLDEHGDRAVGRRVPERVREQVCSTRSTLSGAQRAVTESPTCASSVT